MKKCRVCLVIKSLDEFHNDKSYPGGKLSQCKRCKNAAVRRGQHRLQRENPLHYRQKRIRSLYKITIEEHALRQTLGCEICGILDQKLFVDHDHSCCPRGSATCGNCIRGFLCPRCNVVLGWIENYEHTEQAIQYLERYRERE